MHAASSTLVAAALLLAPAALGQSVTKLTVNANGVHSIFDSAVGPYGDCITPDGRYAVFSSGARELVPNTPSFYDQIYLYDTVAGTFSIVSASPSTGAGHGDSQHPAVSDDGRFVAYRSLATELVPGPWIVVFQIYVTDRQTGVTTVASLTNNTTVSSGNANSSTPSISGDGRVVAFASEATNFVLSDSNGVTDVFVRDLVANTTRAVSRIPAGAFGDAASKAPAVSGDGRFVAFETLATNLAPGGTAAYSKILVRDLAAGTFELVSVNSSGVAANAASFQPSITSDGSRIAFLSGAGNLAATAPGTSNAYLRNRTTGTTVLINTLPDGTPSNGTTTGLRISDNGAFAAFLSTSNNLTPGHVGFFTDAFVLDLTTKFALRASTPLVVPGEFSGVDAPAIGGVSDDGRFTTFQTRSTVLVPGEPFDTVVDVYLCEATRIWYRDVDGDSYGDDANSIVASIPPASGYSSLPGDCNDLDPAIHPGMLETCNGVDDDCDGFTDEIAWNRYCSTATSTAGCVPTVSITGCPSASASSGCFVQGSLLPGGKQAIAIYGLVPTSVAYGFGSSSTICVAAPRQRTLNLPTGGAAASCEGTYSFDWLDYVATHPNSPGQPLQAGQTFYAQIWYRDPGAVLNSNLTGGVAFTLCP